MTKEIINWSGLSKYLTKTNSKTAIRENNIPNKYKDRVNKLIYYVNKWIDEEELYTKQSVVNKYQDEIRQSMFKLKDEVEVLRDKVHKLAENPL